MKTFVAARTGEFRLEDVPRDFRDGAHDVRVVVVSGIGAECEHVVGFVEKWQATSWTWLFACSRCAAPARVLRLDHADQLACNRCVRHQSLGQRQHRTRWWRQHDGELTDRLSRLALRAHGGDVKHLESVADQLKRGASARASSALDLAVAAITVADHQLFGGRTQ